MLKTKKSSVMQKSPISGTVLEYPQPDAYVDNIMRIVGNFGFQQILLPLLEERKNFTRFQTLSRLYGDNILAVTNATEDGMILAPTKMSAVMSRYLALVANQGMQVSKWFHLSPVVKFEQGKYQSFHELGLYVLGDDSPLASVQLINTAAEIFRELGSTEFTIQLNSLGCASCQKNYQELISTQITKGSSRLCADCESDFEKDPLVMWTCGKSSCLEIAASAPPLIDSLDEACKTSLMAVLESIDELGIPYTLNPSFVPQFSRRQVVFQVAAANDASSNPVGYGGNFSSFAQEFAGSTSPPVLGMLTTFERLMSIVPEERKQQGPKIEVFMVPLGSIAARKAMTLHRDLQHSGIAAAESMLAHPSIKNQLKVAAEKKCEIALIIGQKEALDETVILRDMRSGMQELFALERIIEEVKKRLGK